MDGADGKGHSDQERPCYQAWCRSDGPKRTRPFAHCRRAMCPEMLGGGAAQSGCPITTSLCLQEGHKSHKWCAPCSKSKAAFPTVVTTCRHRLSKGHYATTQLHAPWETIKTFLPLRDFAHQPYFVTAEQCLDVHHDQHALAHTRNAGDKGRVHMALPLKLGSGLDEIGRE